MAEEPVKTKSKWKSRTVWIALIGVILGAIEPVSTALGTPITVPNYIYEVLIGLGLYTARAGSTPIK